MSSIKDALMLLISFICILITVTTNAVLEFLNEIMFRLMISEKMCAKCTKKFDYITLDTPICADCAQHLAEEDEEDECEDDMHDHSKPIDHSHYGMYR